MKCVTNNKEVRRVSEDRALELVGNGWKFCSKKIWKESPNTTWVRNINIPNPMSENKKRSKALRNNR